MLDLRPMRQKSVEETVRFPRLIRFGTFEVDLQAQELRKAGLRLKLSGQPFQVLAILLEQPGQSYSGGATKTAVAGHLR